MDMKPREFWMSENDIFRVDERATEPPSNSGYLVHLREVLPGAVTISREEFRAACNIARKDSNRSSGFESTLEHELFGKLTD